MSKIDEGNWITIFRQVKENWIYKDNLYFSAWIKILLEVNHSDAKDGIPIKGTRYECSRGQSIKSLATWVDCLGKGWSIQKLRTFFKLLSECEMINIENIGVSTRLTVCNYDTYQPSQQASNTQPTSKQQATNKQLTTNNNDNNEKKVKKVIVYSDEFENVWNAYTKKGNKVKAYAQWKKLTADDKAEIIELVPKMVLCFERNYLNGFESLINPDSEIWKSKALDVEERLAKQQPQQDKITNLFAEMNEQKRGLI